MLVVPIVNTEDDLLYVVSPWIYISSFLLFTRTIENKKDWLYFGVLFLIACELRFWGFLGDTEELFDLYSLLLLILLAVATIIPYFVDRFYQKKGHGPMRVMAFPLARVLMEKLIIGKQFNLSLTQFGNKWLIQSAAFVGDVFITMIVALIPSVVIYMIVEKENRKMKRAGSVVIIVFALIMVLGGVRYESSRTQKNAIVMAYATGPQKTYYEEASDDDPEFSENLAYLSRSVRVAADNGAKLIAFAEEAFGITRSRMADFIDVASQLADENDIYILLSLDIDNEDGEYINMSTFINCEGMIMSSYVKSNLIPVVEDSEYIEGTGIIPVNYITIDGKEHVVSYTICYDATFSEYVISMDENTDIFINPSWDWAEIDDLNYRMQGMSAIESGVELFKPTVDGWSIVSSPYGRLTYKESSLGEDYNRVHFVNVYPGRTKTLYRSIQKPVMYFWTILVGLLLVDICRIIIMMIVKRKRDNK